MTTSLPTFQPLQVYPDNAASHDQPSSNSSSSNGSFSQVFIVLAIILVISVLGCIFGRLFCKGESSKPKQMDHVRSKEKGKSLPANKHNAREFPGNHHQEEDLEFGFDKLKPIPSSKVAASDHHVGGSDGGGGGGFGLVGFKPVTRNWEAKGIKHVRFPSENESKLPGPGHFRW